MLGPTGLEVVGALEVNGVPTKDDFDQIKEIGKALAKKICET